MINSLKRKEIKLETMYENIFIEGYEKLRKFFNKNSQSDIFRYYNLYSGDDFILVIPILFFNKVDSKLTFLNEDNPYICISYLCIKFNNGPIEGNPNQNDSADYSIINSIGLIDPSKTQNTITDLESIEGFEEVEDEDGNTIIKGKVGCKKNLTYYFFINRDDTNPIIYNNTDYFYIISKGLGTNDFMYISSSLFTFDLKNWIVVFNENCPFLPINYKDYMVNEINKVNFRSIPDWNVDGKLVENINFYKNGKDILLARWFSKSIPKDNPDTSSEILYNLDDCYYCFCYSRYMGLYNEID